MIFQQLDLDEKLICLAGYNFKVLEKQELIAAPNVVYNLPKPIEVISFITARIDTDHVYQNNIDHYSFVVLMDPSIAAYINVKIGPVAVLQVRQGLFRWVHSTNVFLGIAGEKPVVGIDSCCQGQ